MLAPWLVELMMCMSISRSSILHSSRPWITMKTYSCRWRISSANSCCHKRKMDCDRLYSLNRISAGNWGLCWFTIVRRMDMADRLVASPELQKKYLHIATGTSWRVAMTLAASTDFPVPSSYWTRRLRPESRFIHSWNIGIVWIHLQALGTLWLRSRRRRCSVTDAGWSQLSSVTSKLSVPCSGLAPTENEKKWQAFNTLRSRDIQWFPLRRS